MSAPSVPLAWLRTLADVARAVSRAGPLDELLSLIASAACELTNYDFAAVFTPDGDARRLLVRGAAGFSAGYPAKVNDDHPARLLGSGPAARAFTGRRPVTVTDIERDVSFRPWAGVAHEQGFRSVACMPLLAGEPVGVLACYTRTVHDFPASELTLLEAIAEQAVIAIEGATLRARERATIAELAAANRSLQAQQLLLERAEDLHRNLMRVAFEGEGLDPLAQALARMLSTPIVIEDGDGRVLATGGEPRTEERQHWACAPVLRGGEAVARVWMERRPGEVGPLERRVLDNGALVVALELLKERTAEEVAWRLSGDLLSDVLDEEPRADPAPVLARAARLHHDLARPHTVIVIRPDLPGEGAERLVALVRRLSRSAAPRALVGRRGDDAVLLWPEADDGRPDARGIAETVRRQAREDLRETVSAAVGPGPAGLAGLATAYRSARGALDLGRSRSDRLVQLDDLSLEGLLLQVRRPESLLDFADGVLGPLRDSGDGRSAPLLATLRAYVDADCNTSEAAQRLVVHPNTVAYRLRRITELTGLDLSVPDTLLEVTLALRIDDLGGRGEDRAGR